MSEIKTPAQDKVPIGQKAAFGAGHFVLNLLPGALAVFMFFLVTAFGMDPFLAGLLGGIPRIFDALTDPIMGFISDNTKSKWGRRRPYIFFGAILSGILFALLFQLSEDNSVLFNFWYFLMMSLFFLVGNTMFATPLVGLGYEMTPDYNERTRLMAFANTVGQIAWMLVPWFWVVIADPTVFPLSEETLRMIGELGLSGEELQKLTDEKLQATGVRKLSLLVGLTCAAIGILPAFFCKGMDAGDMKDRKKISLRTLSSTFKDLFKGIKEVSQSKPFMKLCGATFLVFNGFQIVASFSFFIIVFYIYNGDYGQAQTWPAWFASITALLTAFLVIPIISKIANRYGKRNAFLISTVISILGYILKWWGFDNSLNARFNQSNIGQSLNSFVASVFETLNPFLESINMSWFSLDMSQGAPWLMFLPIPFMAFGLGGLFTLMMSMTADVCDLDELENGLPRKEGTFGAIYWWMVKVGQALALVLSGAILTLVGFDEGAVSQTLETMNRLRIADIIVPVSTAAVAFIVMWRYDLDEKRVREIGAELKKRKALPKRTSSSYHAQNLLSLTSLQMAPDFKYDIDFSSKSMDDMTSLFSNTLHKGMHGLCFSPYEEGQDIEDVLSEEQIIRRVDIVKPYTNWLRSFSCTGGNEYIPQVAKRAGLKTMAGAWISDDKKQNQTEIEELIKLGKAGHVDIAVVGNEVLLREELTEEELLAYIEIVKKALPGIPVGYVDAYSLFTESSSLIEACDVILINCYPFWEGAEIELATSYLREMYSLVKAKAKGKPVMIAETGWPGQGENTGKAIPTRLNAMKYFINVNNWANQEHIDLFYFSSFDESWKTRHEGDVGQRWGIWDKNETLKYK
ncbi:MFS transporter [Psychroflexus sp. YR1-1]|uniref:Endo-1,3-beta-glucanase btgC n=1 Tax=Psychroflexus aurantiacus TaxID=2709310 RepID=A0A6B3QY68_9FLAO|nr:MFS transporter [Psychroflexus aurantiacus]NEV92692.1 MFS transporter [Psychroflexus aurantiacus]